MNFLFEKFLSAGCWEEIKEYNNTNYEYVKQDIEQTLGACSFNPIGKDAIITTVKPLLEEGEYRIIFIGEEPREVIG